MNIPKMMGKFQMQASKRINILRDTPETPNWQANYHDHVIRNRASYICIKPCIIQNPEKWKDDRFFMADDRRRPSLDGQTIFP